MYASFDRSLLILHASHPLKHSTAIPPWYTVAAAHVSYLHAGEVDVDVFDGCLELGEGLVHTVVIELGRFIVPNPAP